jgi:hypothetical protein
MRRLWQVLAARPVEPVIGLVVMVLGSVAAASRQATAVRTWGAVLAGLGGVLVSWSAGVAYSREQAVAEIEDRLLSFSRQLGTEASNISLAVDGAQRGSFSPETCFALLSQSLNSLTNIVAEIQAQLGNEFDPQGLIATRERIAELTRNLDSDEPPSKDELKAIKASLDDLSHTLAAATALPGLVNRPRQPSIREVVRCSNCNAPNEVQLGAQAGATALVRCGDCGVFVNVHRSAGGAAFTRIMRPPSDPLPPVQVRCTKCDGEITARVRAGITSQKVVCTRCGGSFDLDTNRLELTFRTTFLRVDTDVIGKRNSRPLVACSGCARQLAAAVRTGDAYFAICEPCSLLLHVTGEQFRAFKEDAGHAHLATQG